MYELDAIESININQLVTATDRLLFRASRSQRGRRSFDFSREAAVAVAASHARANANDKTVFVRGTAHRNLLGAAIAIATVTWFAVSLACLLV